MDPLILACPVCSARFRGARLCSRCGADLTPLMKLAAAAWVRREAARRDLREGRFEQAREQAGAAQILNASKPGRRLDTLAAWAATIPSKRKNS